VKHSVVVLAVLCAGCQRVPETAARPALDVDAGLLAEIRSISAIDNHAHPVRPTAAGEAPDREYDALPVENLEPASDPVRQRPGTRELAEARAHVLGYDNAGGDPAKVLDQLGIGVMLANRVSMGPPGGAGLPSDRFLWVPYADALMYPLSNDSMAGNPDRKAFFALEENLLRRYYSESGVAGRPSSLDDYLNKVVRATIERQKQGGAVAEKFEMAYLRPLDIGDPAKAEAEAAWAGRGSYKALQDYIFRFIAAECGRLGMAVHFHTGTGGGSYFDVAGSNPILLEPLLDDPSLRKTNFVFLHGGWPFERQVTALLMKPNAYADFSAQNLFNYPAELAKTIRAWLEFVPEKVLFATDAYPYSAEAGWEETGYIAAMTSREALAIALTGMLRDAEITRARASELARMVLRDNARALYKLK
jgi:predicted TIM-barrel fold metal-dependent hydrolase